MLVVLPDRKTVVKPDKAIVIGSSITLLPDGYRIKYTNPLKAKKVAEDINLLLSKERYFGTYYMPDDRKDLCDESK